MAGWSGAGGILLTVATAATPHGLFLFLIVAQTIFGFGGGCNNVCFPISSSVMTEQWQNNHHQCRRLLAHFKISLGIAVSNAGIV